MRHVSQWASEPACLSCPEPRPEDAWRKGWQGPYCPPCRSRWRRNGYPPDGPPPPRVRGRSRTRTGRIEDYAELRSWGEPPERAAERLRVSFRTVQRYEAELRDRDTERLAA